MEATIENKANVGAGPNAKPLQQRRRNRVRNRQGPHQQGGAVAKPRFGPNAPNVQQARNQQPLRKPKVEANPLASNFKVESNPRENNAKPKEQQVQGANARRFGRVDDFSIIRRLDQMSGPTHELPPNTVEECKFTSRSRLYVGNLPNDTKESELRDLFGQFGEVGEVFLNTEKNFAFLRIDYQTNAEKAKREVDGIQHKGRVLRVRYAPNSSILRVKNLSPFVSNELLYQAFEVFGPLERAVITVDDRGKHTGEGIVEFSRKSSAQIAMRLCAENCFYLTASLRPCFVEPLELNDETDGLPDKSLNKRSQEFYRDRDVGPRFARKNSFEHSYGFKWKELNDMYKAKQEALKRELVLEETKLEAQMEYERFQHETEALKKELMQREQNNDRIKMEWEMRQQQVADQLQQTREQQRQQSQMFTRRQNNDEMSFSQQQEQQFIANARKLNQLLGAGGDGGDPNQSNLLNNIFDGGNNMNNMANQNMNNHQGQQQRQRNIFDAGNNRVQQMKANNRQRNNAGGGNKPGGGGRRF